MRGFMILMVTTACSGSVTTNSAEGVSAAAGMAGTGGGLTEAHSGARGEPHEPIESGGEAAVGGTPGGGDGGTPGAVAGAGGTPETTGGAGGQPTEGGAGGLSAGSGGSAGGTGGASGGATGGTAGTAEPVGGAGGEPSFDPWKECDGKTCAAGEVCVVAGTVSNPNKRDCVQIDNDLGQCNPYDPPNPNGPLANCCATSPPECQVPYRKCGAFLHPNTGKSCGGCSAVALGSFTCGPPP